MNKLYLGTYRTYRTDLIESRLRFLNSDLLESDPDKNRLDPQPCVEIID